MSLSQVIDCIGRREPFRVIRPMGGVDVKGEYQRNPPQDFPATGAIQQADPKMLEKLPEGERSKEALIVFTETELRNVRAAKDGEADILKMRGAEWDKGLKQLINPFTALNSRLPMVEMSARLHIKRDQSDTILQSHLPQKCAEGIFLCLIICRIS